MERTKSRARSILEFAVFAAGCFFLSWLCVRRLSVYRLSDVNTVDCRNGCLYGFDVRDQGYVAFRIDLETKAGQTIPISASENGSGLAVSMFTVTAAGDAYLRISHSGKEGEHEDIARCNFDAQRLETVLHLEEYEDLRLRAMVPYQDTLRLVFEGQGRRMISRRLDGEALSSPGRGLFESGYLYKWAGEALFGIREDNWICRWDADGEQEMLFCNTGSEEAGWNRAFRFYEDAVYFENSKSGQTYRMDLTKKPYQALACEPPCAPAERFSGEDFHAFYNDPEGIRYGILRLEDGRYVAAVCGAREYVADRVEWGRRKKLVCWLALSGLFLCLGGLPRAWACYLKRKEIAVPLVMQAGVVAAAFMAAGVWALKEQVTVAVQRNVEKSNIRVCMEIGRCYMDTCRMEAIRQMCGWSAITAENSLPLREEDFRYRELDYWDADRQEAVSRFNLHFQLFFQKDGELYALDSDRYRNNIPAAYNYDLCPAGVGEKMEKALAENRVEMRFNEQMDGRAFSVFIPFLDSPAGRPLLLEVELSADEANRMAAEQMLEIQTLLYAFSAFLAFSVLALIWLGMRPMASLRQAALLMVNGKLGAQAAGRGRSEAAVTAMHFNHMSGQIAGQVSAIEAFRKKYAAFVPRWFSQEAGASMEEAAGALQGEYAVLTIGLCRGGAPQPGAGPALSRQIEMIRACGGDVLSFADEGLCCLFPDHPEDALAAALHILKECGPSGGVLAAGACFERIRLGITGNRERSAVTACGADGNLSGFLMGCAKEYGASLLITEREALQIPEFASRYHARLLGTIRLEREKRLERVYEILDGAPDGMRRKKLLTAGLFAEGLEAFERRSYLEARMAFIRVFAENQEDGAALRYIRLCESALAAPREEKQRFMEVYGYEG